MEELKDLSHPLLKPSTLPAAQVFLAQLCLGGGREEEGWAVRNF